MQIKMIVDSDISKFEEQVNDFMSNINMEVLSVDYETYIKDDNVEYSAMILYVQE